MSKVIDSAILEAHRHCALHFDEIMRSDLCGCFYCLKVFPPSAIRDWFDDHNVGEGKEGATALCPHCGIDSIIGSASKFPITAEFLSAMHRHYFEK